MFKATKGEENAESKDFYQNLKEMFASIANRLHISDQTFLIVLAVFVGIGAGFAAIGFRMLISMFNDLFFGNAKNVLSFLGDYYVILVPAVGGLLVGPIIYFFAREAKGHGVPEVMAAVALKGGRIRPRVVLVKAFASAISIGSGGSVGREGPIVQIGSALGSTVGQIFKMSDQRIRDLVAAGAAGGIAATFNAPIAGVIFALEVIIGQFTTKTFSLIVISSVTASVIGRTFAGNAPAFIVPEYAMHHWGELFLYVILGILAGIFGIVYIKVLYKFEDFFDSMVVIPEYLRPVVGGLAVGLMGYFYYQIFGVGYETIESALRAELLLGLMLTLLVLKLVATSITIGSGGSGGVFAPGLYMGAMLGGSFGVIVNMLFPGMTASYGAYAVVGMGAVFAGSAKAPITAILILFEMTNDYRIILPLMIAVVISTFTANGLFKETIYTVKLARKGLKIKGGKQIDVMEGIKVQDVMMDHLDTISVDHTVDEVAGMLSTSRHHGFPILDKEGRLAGIVTYQDVKEALLEDKQNAPVIQIATTDVIKALPAENLNEVLARMAKRGIGRVPVVHPDSPDRLIGIITRSDIISAYNREVMKRAQENS